MDSTDAGLNTLSNDHEKQTNTCNVEESLADISDFVRTILCEMIDVAVDLDNNMINSNNDNSNNNNNNSINDDNKNNNNDSSNYNIPDIMSTTFSSENTMNYSKKKRSDARDRLPEEDLVEQASKQASFTTTNLFAWFSALKEYISLCLLPNRCEVFRNAKDIVTRCKILVCFQETKKMEISLNFGTGVIKLKGEVDSPWFRNCFEVIRGKAHELNPNDHSSPSNGSLIFPLTYRAMHVVRTWPQNQMIM